MSKELRLSRLFSSSSDRAIICPVDHGLTDGQMRMLPDPVSLVASLIEEPVDGFLMSYGVSKLTECVFHGRGVPSRILAADVQAGDRGGVSQAAVVTVEQALRMGVEALKIVMRWTGTAAQRVEVCRLIAEFVRECDRNDLPLMVEPVVGPSAASEDRGWPGMTEDACRVALELGADIIKVGYPGELTIMRRWAEDFHVPIVLLDSTVHGSREEYISDMVAAFCAGARGIVCGINVWGRGVDEAKVIYRALAGWDRGETS